MLAFQLVKQSEGEERGRACPYVQHRGHHARATASGWTDDMVLTHRVRDSAPEWLAVPDLMLESGLASAGSEALGWLVTFSVTLGFHTYKWR